MRLTIMALFLSCNFLCDDGNGWVGCVWISVSFALVLRYIPRYVWWVEFLLLFIFYDFIVFWRSTKGYRLAYTWKRMNHGGTQGVWGRNQYSRWRILYWQLRYTILFIDNRRNFLEFSVGVHWILTAEELTILTWALPLWLWLDRWTADKIFAPWRVAKIPDGEISSANRWRSELRDWVSVCHGSKISRWSRYCSHCRDFTHWQYQIAPFACLKLWLLPWSTFFFNSLLYLLFLPATYNSNLN